MLLYEPRTVAAVEAFFLPALNAIRQVDLGHTAAAFFKQPRRRLGSYVTIQLALHSYPFERTVDTRVHQVQVIRRVLLRKDPIEKRSINALDTLSVPDINLGALRAPGCPRSRCGQSGGESLAPPSRHPFNR